MTEMQTSRGRILRLLQRNKGANADELARELDLASATVRRHLDVLQREGVVAYSEVRRRTGRPHFRYHLTELGRKRLPQNYHLLAQWLFQEITALKAEDVAGKDGGQVLALALARASRELVATHAHRLNHPSLERRVAELAQLLDENGFMTEWREDEDGYRLLAYHCPYYLVASSMRQVCTLDQALISGLLQAPVTREECLLDSKLCCVYHIEKQSPAMGGPGSVTP